MSRFAAAAGLVVGLVGVLLVGCSRSKYPADVSEALELAGDNRAELEQVIAHYEEVGDSLKLQAAYFLIGNMEGHSYVTYRFFDTAGATVAFDVLEYASFQELLDTLRMVEETRGELDYERDTTSEDLTSITADYLIGNIDLAFEAWRTKPWAKALSFDDFCRYVLPYRGSNEPLESWRKHFLDRYSGIDSALEDPTSPMQAAAAINDDVRSWFTFDERYYLHPTDLGLAEMLETGMGRCEDMTNLSIYAMRANGLAVTSDYTPYWATCGNNHAWNAILGNDGTVVPFMGAEANPGEYRLSNGAAKVYRKTYDKQSGNLVYQPNKQESIPGWLKGKTYVDVTADYYDVCDVAAALDAEVPDSVDIAYLCVFNSGEFKPIHWGRIENGTVMFTDMNKGLLYLPAFYLNEEIVPCGEAFTLDEDCMQHALAADTAKLISVKLSAVPIRAMAASSESVSSSPLTKGQEYELMYWDGDWQSLGTKAAKGTSVSFGSVPVGGLYWLVAVDGNSEERPFTIEDGAQRFW